MFSWKKLSKNKKFSGKIKLESIGTFMVTEIPSFFIESQKSKTKQKSFLQSEMIIKFSLTLL
jgi:hypothetical protein